MSVQASSSYPMLRVLFAWSLYVRMVESGAACATPWVTISTYSCLRSLGSCLPF